MITSALQRTVENSLASNGRECIIYTAPFLSGGKPAHTFTTLLVAEAATFIAVAVLISLGYFIGLAQSSLLPKRIVKFLGFLVDSQHCAFILPEDKKHKFAALRESILEKKIFFG